MKGDRVRVLVDVGNDVREFVVEADKAGRTVEVVEARGGRMLEVRVLTRRNTVVLTDRFMSGRVVALIEERQEREDEQAPQFKLPERADIDPDAAAEARDIFTDYSEDAAHYNPTYGDGPTATAWVEGSP